MMVADTTDPHDARWLPWREAPPELVSLLRDQASRNGIEIVRDEEVVLDCVMPDGGVVTFRVFWPSGDVMNVRLKRAS